MARIGHAQCSQLHCDVVLAAIEGFAKINTATSRESRGTALPQMPHTFCVIAHAIVEAVGAETTGTLGCCN